MQEMGLMMISCGMAVKRMGMLRSEGEEDVRTDYVDGDSDSNW